MVQTGIVTDPRITGADPVLCLTSSCVTVPDRLIPDKVVGVFPPKIQGRREFENWETGEVPCKHQGEHIGARQIFKVFNHTHLRTPTIKHHCPRTDLAASLRACSNKVTEDPQVFDKFETWFRDTYIPNFVGYLENEEVKVNLDDWLDSGRYPINYRKKLRKAFDIEKWTDSKLTYEAFPKIEMQFTEVMHTQKDTELNTVKERQICGPSDEKKCLANAFVNELERIAHKYFKPYCGRKDWMMTCETIEKGLQNVINIIFGAADGSGFDMSQLQRHNKLMNELIMECANHKNVVFDEPLTKEGLLRALQDSIILNVSVNKGDLKYTAQGRASGDGWTTFGNTMLMIAYYMYAFKIANIEDFFLLVKGDDVLLGISAEQKQAFESAHAQLFTNRKDKHQHGLAQICTDIKWGGIEDMDFLSNHFFFTGKGRLRMTRIPARVFQTISWSTKMVNVPVKDVLTVQRELCYSKGMCLRAWGRGLPMWEVLADKMIELGKQGNLSEYNQHVDAYRTWQNRDDYDAYLLYLEQRFGVTKEDVRNFEQEVKKITTISGFKTFDFIDRFYATI